MHNIMFNKKNKHSAPLECGYSILMKNADAMIEGKSKEDQIFILIYGTNHLYIIRITTLQITIQI